MQLPALRNIVAQHCEWAIVFGTLWAGIFAFVIQSMRCKEEGDSKAAFDVAQNSAVCVWCPSYASCAALRYW